MQVKTVIVEFSITFNLGNYQSCKPSISLSADVIEGDSSDEIIEGLKTEVISHCFHMLDITKQRLSGSAAEKASRYRMG